MSLTINLEIGHDASLRTKTTQEGFTHDWEVFVRGCNGAEIHYYVEKVVFHLHVTFTKPKRVVKEPPYSLKTSGYAGFNLPIDVYLRNNQEPKRIRFNYDLELQPTGPPIHRLQKEKYVFHNPSDEFRNKLLKGGAVVGGSGNSQETTEKPEEKPQMTSKPKLSGSETTKKYKMRQEDRTDDAFTNLFGTPITKTSRTEHPPPKHKETTKNSASKPEKAVVDKEKPKTKSPYKDKDRDKDKPKEKTESGDKKSKEDKKDKKDKKDKERSKDKKDRKEREREKSPHVRTKSPSPKRSPKITRSPSPPKTSSSKDKESSKERDSKDKREDKKSKKDKHKEHKENKYKDKDKERDRDRNSGDVKDYRNRDSSKTKDNNTAVIKEEETSLNNSTASVASHQSQYSQKAEKKEKTKEKEPVVKDHPKEIEEKQEKIKTEKTEDKPKHKHKKKDKDRKERKEEKSHKQDKKSEKTAVTSSVKDVVKETPTVTSSKEKTIDRNNLFGSPKSDPPSTPVESKRSHSLTGLVDDDTSASSKASSREPSPVPPPVQAPPTPPPVVEAPPPSKKPEPEPVKKTKEESSKQKKDKKEKKKDKKGDRERRKRKSDTQTQAETEEPPEKLTRDTEHLNNNSDDERKVSSTEDANPPAVTDDAEAYMSMLRDLQHKIMGLKDNSDLQKVVQLIAETGRYEVSANTFDFDLCLLDRSTVRQLQDFFATVPTT